MTKREIEYYFGVTDHSQSKGNIILAVNTSHSDLFLLLDTHLFQFLL